MRHTNYLIKNRAGDVLETVPAIYGLDSFEIARGRLATRRLKSDCEPSDLYMVPESAARHTAPGNDGRWRTLGISLSGKSMWECTSCGRMSITPDKNCPTGCTATDADRIADLEARLRKSEEQRATIISVVTTTLDAEIERWRRSSEAFARGIGFSFVGPSLATLADAVANELTRIRNLIAPAPEENIF